MSVDSDGKGRLRIALGSDHEGHALKERLIGMLREERHGVKDCSVQKSEPSEPTDVVALVAQTLAAGEADLGIVVSGSGAVASMAGNKLPGVRSCHCQDTFTARQARRATAANILCLGSRVVGDELAAEVVRAFVGAAPSDRDRHSLLRRKLASLEDDFDAADGAWSREPIVEDSD